MLMNSYEPVKFKRKVVKVGNSHAILLPKNIVDFMEIQKGTHLNFCIRNKNEILLQKIY